jgi:hypothetical protein
VEEEEWGRRGREWAFAYATHDKSVSAHVRKNSSGFKSSLFIGNLSPTEPFSSCVIHLLWDHLPTRVSVFFWPGYHPQQEFSQIRLQVSNREESREN